MIKIVGELKFKLWGFSTVRIALFLDALIFLYFIGYAILIQAKPYDCSVARELLSPASVLLLLALIFCFLPPYSKTKLYLCWPLTGLAMLILMLLIPL